MIILDLMLGYDQELRATYNFIQSLKHAYNQRDFTTFFQLLKLRPDSVSHYTIHRCQVLARYKEGLSVALRLSSQMVEPKGLIIELRLSNELPVVIVTLRHLKLGFI